MGQSRNEDILENMLGAHNPLGEPKSREEALLMQLLEKLSVTVWVDITGTLEAGETEITLNNSTITTDSTIEVFDSFDIPYVSKSVSTGSITLTFDEQDADMTVKVRIS